MDENVTLNVDVTEDYTGGPEINFMPDGEPKLRVVSDWPSTRASLREYINPKLDEQAIEAYLGGTDRLGERLSQDIGQLVISPTGDIIEDRLAIPDKFED